MTRHYVCISSIVYDTRCSDSYKGLLTIAPRVNELFTVEALFYDSNHIITNHFITIL